MKRHALAIWALLAVIVVGLGLLVDPFRWFAGASVDTSFAEPEAAVPGDEDVPVVELAGGTDSLAAKQGVTSGRKAVDPLVEAGIVAFRVLDWTGQIVPDAQVVIVRGEELLCDQRTNAEGVAKATADGEAAGLIVILVARPLEWFDVVLTAGSHEISLTEGSRLRGRFVDKDGGSPGKLHVSFNSDRPPTVIPDLPGIVDEVIRAWTLRGAYAAFDTDEEGAFDITGLPADWSGRLRMRGGWKVLSTTHGEIEASAGGVRFTEPAMDVVVRLAPHRTLHGRLVLRDDGSPLEGAKVAALLRSPQARQPTHTSAKTDEGGRFSFESKEGLVSEFELRLGARFQESAPLLRLDAESIPANGDLGDVVVDDVRHVPFLLQDSEAVPIPRGQAVAAGVRSERTGEDGRGELRWIARAVDELVAEAQGFVPTAQEIPPVVVDPLVVTLGRANRLDVKLVLPEGATSEQFKVVLRGEGTITAGPVRDVRDQLRHVALGRWAFPTAEFSSAPADTFLCGQPDPQTNTVTFCALLPGVGIELEIRGITGNVVYHSEILAPLSPAEHRKIEVPLEIGMTTFRGHVRDEEGRPLQLAFIHLGYQLLGTTDVDGAFEFLLSGSEKGTLVVQHLTCTTLYLQDYVIPTDGRPVEFRLRAARTLTIDVVDESGTPVPEAEVFTLFGDFMIGTRRIEGHRHLVNAMPDGPFEIRALLAGREFDQPHDPAISEATVVLPVPGSVFTVLGDAITAGRTGRFILHIMPPDLDIGRPMVKILPTAPGLRLKIPIVFPGTYLAMLSYDPSDEEKAVGQERVRSERVTIEVVAGQQTEVLLTLPADDD